MSKATPFDKPGLCGLPTTELLCPACLSKHLCHAYKYQDLYRKEQPKPPVMPPQR